jgi:hypothetical protein
MGPLPLLVYSLIFFSVFSSFSLYPCRVFLRLLSSKGLSGSVGVIIMMIKRGVPDGMGWMHGSCSLLVLSLTTFSFVFLFGDFLDENSILLWLEMYDDVVGSGS